MLIRISRALKWCQNYKHQNELFKDNDSKLNSSTKEGSACFFFKDSKESRSASSWFVYGYLYKDFFKRNLLNPELKSFHSIFELFIILRREKYLLYFMMYEVWWIFSLFLSWERKKPHSNCAMIGFWTSAQMRNDYCFWRTKKGNELITERPNKH